MKKNIFQRYSPPCPPQGGIIRSQPSRGGTTRSQPSRGRTTRSQPTQGGEIKIHPYQREKVEALPPLGGIKGGVISTLFLLFISTCLLAQPTDLNSKTIDKKTYRLYLQKNWDSLIITGKQALKENIDYFYLRMRIGIAYYEIENYRKAAYHFEKAIKFNTNDQAALEYLYYCYLNTNRDLEANELSEKFPESLQQKIKPGTNRIINNIYFETGPTFSNNISKNQRSNLMGKDSIYGEQDLNDNKYYLQLGLKQYLGKRFSLYLGYSNLTISKLKQIQAP